MTFCKASSRHRTTRQSAFLTLYTRIGASSAANLVNEQIVVDTDVASYIFNWHSSAKRYVDELRGSQLVLCFMSIAEMRMGAIAAGWGAPRRALLERFMAGFGAIYADDALCTSWAQLRADARAFGRALSPQDAWIAAAALGLGAPLATNNRGDFEHVPSLRLLTF